MKHKNKRRRLAGRIAEWEALVAKKPDAKKAYRKPGSFNK